MLFSNSNNKKNIKKDFFLFNNVYIFLRLLNKCLNINYNLPRTSLAISDGKKISIVKMVKIFTVTIIFNNTFWEHEVAVKLKYYGLSINKKQTVNTVNSN